MIWANPEWFWLFAVIPVLIGLYIWRTATKKRPRVMFSNVANLKNIKGNWRAYGSWLSPFLMWSALALIVLAMARPQLRETTVERSAEGIDIVLVLDISTSMRAEDLKPNRFEAARNVANNFITRRKSDRISLVVFAGQSFTVCPLTLDYDLVTRLLSDVRMGVVDDGTAIGMGIATSVNRLKESTAKSKVVILLTDGENNAGQIDPVTAADLASTYGIKIYTIGAGSRGTAPYPVEDPIFGKRYQNVKVNIDEEMMTKIATMTGGEYFRATDTENLQNIYQQIDELERTEVEEMIFTDYEDLYPNFLLPGIGLLLFALISEKILFRTTVE